MNLDVIKRIKDSFLSSKIELLCQIPVSEEEYEELLKYVREKARYTYAPTIVPTDEILSIAMTQIAIRAYADGNYWEYFDEEVGIDIPQSKKYYFAQIFAKTIQRYKLFELQKDISAKYSYVENIKAHAFVPNNYLHNYFDFLFSFYDRNLFRQLTDDIVEDIDDLIGFVTDSLKGSGDIISIEKSGNKPAKSYKLLKATRSLIAESSSTVISDMFFDHLVLMDNYYYDGQLPKEADRFSEYFEAWVEKKNSEINSSENSSRKRKAKESFFQKPHFEINRTAEKIFLVIPSQKFRSESGASTANVVIKYGDQIIKKDLVLYKAYGVLVSEEIKIEIKDLFLEYQISIVSNQSHNYIISEKSYRIFDDDFDETTKLRKGQNYILTKKGTIVTGNATLLYRNLDLELWDEYSYPEIEDSSVVYIDGKPLSIIGEFSDKPLFEYVSKEYLLFKNGKQIQTAYKHPIVSFKISKSALPKARLFINDSIYNIQSDCDVSVFDMPNESNMCGVSINLNSLLSCDEGIYIVSLDEPGKSSHLLTKYILITGLRCRPSRQRYTFCQTAEVKISDNYNITPINCFQNEFGEYTTELSSGNEQAKLQLLFQDEAFDLIIPFKVFKFGFNRQWEYMRQDYIWYSDLKNELYLSIPGATAVKAYLNKDEKNCIIAEKYDDGFFKLDISNFVKQIHEGSSSVYYINILFLDNRWRSLSLYRVQRRTWFDHLNLVVNDEIVCVDAKYQSQKNIYVKFTDYNDKRTVAEIEIPNGVTAIPELTRDGLYIMEVFELEPDEYGFEPILNLIETRYKFGYIDINNFSNCKMFITAIYSGEQKIKSKYRYTVFDIQKESDCVYYGKLMYEPKDAPKGIKNKPQTLFEKIRFEVAIDDGQVQILSLNTVEEDDVFVPYYDKKMQILVSENSNLLMNSKEYSRFDPLYEDETTYYVDFRRIR